MSSEVSEVLKFNDQNDPSKTTSTSNFPSVYFDDVQAQVEPAHS